MKIILIIVTHLLSACLAANASYRHSASRESLPEIVTYTNCGNNKDSIKEHARTSAFIVNYPNCKRRILTEMPTDTLHKREINRNISFISSINGGISTPVGVYGSDKYYISGDNSVYCGFASPGYTYNAIMGMDIMNRLEITVMGSYIHNGFNATGFLNENGIFLEDYYSRIYNYNLYPIPLYHIIANGNYSYNDYSILCGVTWHFVIVGPISFGCRFLLGQFSTSIPAIKGIADTNQNLKGSTINISTPAVYSGFNLCADVGARVGVRILPSITLFLSADFIFSGPITSYAPGEYLYSSNTGIINSTFGIQFKY